MIIEIVIAIASGFLIGALTGILPGIHINLVTAAFIPPLLAKTSLDPFALAAGVVSLAATHTIMDFIPAVYLGAPEEETALSVLPAHELLREGKGHEAMLLLLAGALCGAGALLVASLLMIQTFSFIEKISSMLFPFVMLGIAIYMVAREEKIMGALIVFLLAGFLGYIALNIPLKEPLFPLLTGLFGVSGLVISLTNKTPLPPQKMHAEEKTRIAGKEWIKTIRDTLIIGTPLSMVPALGSGYASLIASEVTTPSRKRFLMITSAMSVFTMGASFLVVYGLEKSRTGAAAAIKSLLGSITLWQIAALLIIMVLVTLLACAFAKIISRNSARVIDKCNYKLITICALAFVLAGIAFVSGEIGLVVSLTGAAIGIYAILSRIKRMHLMGCLIVPTLIYYL